MIFEAIHKTFAYRGARLGDRLEVEGGKGLSLNHLCKYCTVSFYSALDKIYEGVFWLFGFH